MEAGLIGSSDIPPLKDTPHTLARCGETFHGYFLEGRLVGAVSHKRSDGIVDIHRLVVHPDQFRKGIGRSLVGHLETVEWGVERIVVSTGAENTPATNLYRSLGFQEIGESEVAAGLRVTLFEKTGWGPEPPGGARSGPQRMRIDETESG